MDRLASDPRTASIDVGWGLRTQVNALAERIHAAMSPNERAAWASVTTGLSTSLMVMTDQRLIVVPISPNKPTETVALPFEVSVGKKKFMGTAIRLVNSHGASVELAVSLDDLTRLSRVKNTAPATAQHPTPPAAAHHSSGPAEPTAPPRPAPEPFVSASPPPSAGRPWAPAGASGPYQEPPAHAPSGGVPGGPGGWNWGRVLHTPRDSEYMAGAHMTYMGYAGVSVTQASGDGGLDVVAQGAAAQVKYQQAPTGGPEIQQLRGAADGFADRLFYATGYTPAAHTRALELGIALFQFTSLGLVVAVNNAAHAVATRGGTPPPERTMFGTLTFESRQNRAIGWAQQISDATQVPISNRVRKGAKQLEKRAEALELMTQGLATLQDSDNPLYKKARRERTLAEAEKTLKKAGLMLGLLLR